MLYLVLLNGLIDSFNPCAIGVLIFYLTLILSLKVARRSFITFGLFYILATYTTYLLIGLGILKVIHLFGVHNFFGWVSAILIIILGLFNLKEFFWPNKYIPILSAFFNRCGFDFRCFNRSLRISLLGRHLFSHSQPFGRQNHFLARPYLSFAL